jgi:hypothetical protein
VTPLVSLAEYSIRMVYADPFGSFAVVGREETMVEGVLYDISNERVGDVSEQRFNEKHDTRCPSS